ncbi:MAG: hypothetical protein ACE37D_13535 [Pseudomonadales bacterium]
MRSRHFAFGELAAARFIVRASWREPMVGLRTLIDLDTGVRDALSPFRLAANWLPRDSLLAPVGVSNEFGAEERT